MRCQDRFIEDPLHRVLQPVLHCSKEGWGVTSNFRSAATEPLSHALEVQNAYYKTGRVSDQIRGLVRHDRSKRRLFTVNVSTASPSGRASSQKA